MANSLMQIISDGSLSTVPLTIKFLEQDHIKVFVDEVELPNGTYTFAWAGTTTITITPAVVAGAEVSIRRKTPANAVLHDFQAGAVFSEQSMDENFRQELYLLQEASEQGFITDLFNDLDMHGNGVRNVRAATLPGDAVNLAQAMFLADGGEASTLRAELAANTGFLAVGDGIIARLSALKAKFGASAWAQAVNYKIFHIDVADTKSTPYVVPPGQTIVFSANVTHTASSKCFDLTGATGCYITGNGEVLGGTTRPSTQDASHFGFYVQDCLRYRIDGNITVKYFGAVGFYADGSSEVSGDVSFSSVSGVRCEENYVGWQLMNGFQQEYTTFSSCWGVRSTVANMILETGNIYWHGGGLSHGFGDGIRLNHPAAGGNPHHGIFSGTEFNHNASHNLLAQDIAYGMDFADCTWFSGGSSTAGDIYINCSRGINIDGGILGCDVRVIEDPNLPHTGWNAIRNMHVFPVDWNLVGARLITGGSFSRNKLLIKGNFTNTGGWQYNDAGGAGVYANYRAPSNVAITSASQTLKLTSKMKDDRNSYDINTGFFTAPFAGVVRCNANLYMNVNSNTLLAGHHLLFFRDDAGTGTAFAQLGKQKVVPAGSNTSASVNAVFEIPVSAGAKLMVQYQAPDFATQLASVDAANSFIAFEMI